MLQLTYDTISKIKSNLMNYEPILLVNHLLLIVKPKIKAYIILIGAIELLSFFQLFPIASQFYVIILL